MNEYLETKRMITNNLIIGTALGLAFAALFALRTFTPEFNEEFFQSAAADGHPYWEAAAFFGAALALMCLILFAFGLLMPFGRTVLKNAKDRMLSGWIVGCLPMALIQAAYLIAVVVLGSAIGLFYLPYSLLRLSAAKRAAGAAKGV